MEESKGVFPARTQEIYEWYQVDSLLSELGQAASELDLAPEDVVHVGGTANFYRCYQAFGPKAVFHFRGTHDMDVVSFTQGSLRRLLDKLKEDEQSHIIDYSTGRSSSLPDKKSIYVSLDSKNNPGLSTGFAIDVYESSTGEIVFNNRRMTKEKIVLDPPEVLELRTLNPRETRGLVCVPSLRDSFIIKMDVVDFSRSGLRPKDKVDVLTTLSVCNALGHDFDNLLEGILETSDTSSADLKFTAIEELLTDFKKGSSRFAIDRDLMPTTAQVNKALESVKKFKHMISFKKRLVS